MTQQEPITETLASLTAKLDDQSQKIYWLASQVMFMLSHLHLNPVDPKAVRTQPVRTETGLGPILTDDSPYV